MKRRTLAALLLVASPAAAEDKGQWNGYRLTSEQKQWFKGVQDAGGIACCSVADGYPISTKNAPMVTIGFGSSTSGGKCRTMRCARRRIPSASR